MFESSLKCSSSGFHFPRVLGNLLSIFDSSSFHLFFVSDFSSFCSSFSCLFSFLSGSLVFSSELLHQSFSLCLFLFSLCLMFSLISERLLFGNFSQMCSLLSNGLHILMKLLSSFSLQFSVFGSFPLSISSLNHFYMSSSESLRL